MAQPAAETRPEPICGMNTWMPVPARLLAVREENFNTRTYTLQFLDEEIRKMYRFAPGQFNMLYVPGVGEAAISISSDPSRTETLDHTIRLVGSVTRAVERLGKNALVGLRGPFGRGWPLEAINTASYWPGGTPFISTVIPALGLRGSRLLIEAPAVGT